LIHNIEKNRKRVKDAGIISTVAVYLNSLQSDLIRTVCGFYLNSSMDYGKELKTKVK
jgi:hypothetical protein